MFFVGYGALALVNAIGSDASYTDTATSTPQAQVLNGEVPTRAAIRLQPSPDGKVHVVVQGPLHLGTPELAHLVDGERPDGQGQRLQPVRRAVCSQDITIQLPPGFTVIASSTGGDVRATALTGPLHAALVGGRRACRRQHRDAERQLVRR